MRLFDLLQMLDFDSTIVIFDSEDLTIIEGRVGNAFGWYDFDEFKVLYFESAEPRTINGKVATYVEVFRITE